MNDTFWNELYSLYHKPFLSIKDIQLILNVSGEPCSYDSARNFINRYLEQVEHDKYSTYLIYDDKRYAIPPGKKSIIPFDVVASELNLPDESYVLKRAKAEIELNLLKRKEVNA